MNRQHWELRYVLCKKKNYNMFYFWCFGSVFICINTSFLILGSSGTLILSNIFSLLPSNASFTSLSHCISWDMIGSNNGHFLIASNNWHFHKLMRKRITQLKGGGSCRKTPEDRYWAMSWLQWPGHVPTTWGWFWVHVPNPINARPWSKKK